jgi:uncharacterized protein
VCALGQEFAVFFHLRDLDVRALPFDVEIAPGAIDFQLGAKDKDTNLNQAGPLRAKGKAELVMGSDGEIRVSGQLTVEMAADCDRCLEPSRFPIDSDFALHYRPVADGYGDEKEIDSGEAEMGFYEGDGVELNDVLREFILLTLPMQRVCRESCKGICPLCGQNRNQKECQCHAETTDDRWAALKSLKS